MTNVIVIPVEGPLQRITIDDNLRALQDLVGGFIEAVPCPPMLTGADRTTCYINEEGKFNCTANMAATDFMVPGVGIFPGDYIAGPLVIVGFNPNTGEHTDTIAPDVIRRLELIADESGRGIADAA